MQDGSTVIHNKSVSPFSIQGIPQLTCFWSSYILILFGPFLGHAMWGVEVKSAQVSVESCAEYGKWLCSFDWSGVCSTTEVPEQWRTMTLLSYLCMLLAIASWGLLSDRCLEVDGWSSIDGQQKASGGHGGGGVTWENLGRLKTRHVAVLWIYCNGLVTVLTVTDRSM